MKKKYHKKMTIRKKKMYNNKTKKKNRSNNNKYTKMKRDRQCVYNCSYRKLFSDKKKTTSEKSYFN